MKYNDKKTSIFISLILRHKPETINKDIREDGYMLVQDLLDGMNEQGYDITMEDLCRIVAEDNKQRYSFSEDICYIRANQGHSIKVDVGLKQVTPPQILYHGSSTRVKEQILQDGIKKMSRQYVHLSADIDTAKVVGSRHGQPVIFTIDTEAMILDGYSIYLSDNGVYLTDYVAPKYIQLLK